MKKYVFICLFIGINFSASAQDIIASFMDKHGKDDNLEVVTIGKKMMEMICTLTSDNPNLTEAIKGLETIRIISSKDEDLNKEYYHSAQALLSKSKGFEEFFSMSEENKELMVMIKESKGDIKELILLLEQPDGFNLISISGTINLDDLVNYSKGLNIKELNQLSSVKRNQ
ncbi:MAG: DUF4252 domain-containing protein [Candidatus Azobacteroides sp.]|nr:DUF4252 domain-containing protein [Candidatus Azobacteroides sp.]